MNLRALFLRVRALAAPRRIEAELHDELAFHIEREAQRHIANGLSPADARARARARFGSMPLTADQCRDARGTAFVDDLVHDISYAVRTFHRAPLAALTIVATVGLGLGLVAAVFTFYSRFALRVDAVHDPGELFSVLRPTRADADSRLPFTRAEYETLRRENTVFTDVAAMVNGIEIRVDGRPASPAHVTGNFFQMLGVHAALGRTLTPADDEAAGSPPIVLSHESWMQWFAGDPAAVGRVVRANGVPCVVVGVMPEDFRGLNVAPPEYWAPLALAGEFRPTADGDEGKRPLSDIVGRLKPVVSQEQATAALNVWASTPANSRVAPGDRSVFIALRPRQGTTDLLESLLLFSPIFFAFGLILMIGCANVANLLLARAVSRQREIGIRLSIGASRWRIIRQLLTESVLLALAAATCGYVVSRVCLVAVSYAVTSTMPAEIAEQVSFDVPPADWRVLVFLIPAALVSTVFFGLVPALQATRIELVRAVRGEVARDARPGRARQALIALQVGASALLLICAAVFLRGAFAASVADPGLRTRDTIRVPIANEPKRAALVRAMTAHPLVAAVAASSGTAAASAFADSAATVDGPAGAPTQLPVGYKFVSPEYFQLLEIDLIRGRGFTSAEHSVDAGVTVISESAARRLWPNSDPIDVVGRTVRIQIDRQTASASQSQANPAPAPFRSFTVVGMARDVGGEFRLFPVLSFKGAYLPADVQTPGTELLLRVRGDLERARVAVIDRLTAVDPALDHEVQTMAIVAGMGTYIMEIAFWVTVLLGGLALALTVSGLFSVLSYLVEQRAKEIGVRMTLGATTGNIAALVLSQMVRPVGYGLLVGGGLAAGLATALMATPAASAIGGIVRVFDPVAYAASVLVIVVACVLAASVPAVRAARVDPIATLRND